MTSYCGSQTNTEFAQQRVRRPNEAENTQINTSENFCILMHKKLNSEQIIFSNHIVSGQNIKTRKLKCRVFSLSLTRCRSCVTERAPTQSTQVSDICTAAALQFERRHNDTKQPGNNKHTQRTGSSSPTVTLYSRGGGEVHNRKGRDNGGRFTHGRDTEPLYRQILLWFCL